MTEGIENWKLADPLWRIENLYSIKQAETGAVIAFRPKPKQQLLFDAIFKDGRKRIIIPKARQYGMSTAVGLILADRAMFSSGVQLSIVDQTLQDATLKLENIVKVAIEEAIKAYFPGMFTIGPDNKGELGIRHRSDPVSKIFAGLNARGGVNQILHLSELGVIQSDDPRRAEEIWTGAGPSAGRGTIIIETTWKGGRGGLLYEKMMESVEKVKEGKTLLPDDWWVLFIPWWEDPSYVLDDGGEIRPDLLEYFEETEARIREQYQKPEFTFSEGQKRWYSKNYLGLFMFREYPSLMEEMFKAPIEGSIYEDVINAAKSEGRIRRMPVDKTALVNTSWDIGAPRNTTTWYWQVRGEEIHVIDVDGKLNLTPHERVAYMLQKGYLYGYHYFPHDAEGTETTGRTPVQVFAEAGLKNIRTVPRTFDVWVGINHLREIFPRLVFRVPSCDSGLERLAYYHTPPSDKRGIGMDMPVHDESSHWADGLRIMAEAHLAFGLNAGRAEQVRPTGRKRVVVKMNIGSLRR